MVEWKRKLVRAIRDAMKHKNLTVTSLAAKMGTSRSQVHRLLDENKGARVSSFLRAAKVLNLDPNTLLALPPKQQRRQVG